MPWGLCFVLFDGPGSDGRPQRGSDVSSLLMLSSSPTAWSASSTTFGRIISLGMVEKATKGSWFKEWTSLASKLHFLQASRCAETRLPEEILAASHIMPTHSKQELRVHQNYPLHAKKGNPKGILRPPQECSLEGGSQSSFYSNHRSFWFTNTGFWCGYNLGSRSNPQLAGL